MKDGDIVDIKGREDTRFYKARDRFNHYLLMKYLFEQGAKRRL